MAKRSSPKRKSTDKKLTQRALGPIADRFGESAAGVGTKAAAVVGDVVEGVALTTGVLLRGVKLLVYAYDQLERRFFPMVEERVATIPEERRIPPPISIAGPTIEAAKFTIEEPELGRMFANLLATAMDSETTLKAHPSFVEMIKQLTPDEARIIKYLGRWPDQPYPLIEVRLWTKDATGYTIGIAYYSHIGREAGAVNEGDTPAGLINIARLGLCELTVDRKIVSEEDYKPLEEDPWIVRYCEDMKGKREVQFIRGYANLTLLGRQFVEACVADRTEGARAA